MATERPDAPAATAPLRTPEQMEWIRGRFKPDGLQRLARAEREYADEHGYYLPDVAALAYAEWERAESAEAELRYEWWLNHGHEGLYGDDGEMQCGRCPADFKRQPLEKLRPLVLAARAERAAKAWEALRG